MTALADRIEEWIEKTPITLHRDDVYIAELFGFQVKRFAHNYCRMRAPGDRYYRQIPRYLADTDAAISLVPNNIRWSLHGDDESILCKLYEDKIWKIIFLFQRVFP